jgi:hypothetical protein
MSRILDMVKDKVVRFVCYRDGDLWYTTECGFSFPVPVEDAGVGTFLNVDKAILFMRWINKQIELEDTAKKERLRSSDTLK